MFLKNNLLLRWSDNIFVTLQPTVFRLVSGHVQVMKNRRSEAAYVSHLSHWRLLK